MIKEVGRRIWTKDQHPAIEIIYKCEYGIIWSAPKYRGGGWAQIEEDAFANALAKYKELLREDNRLIEV